MSATAQRGTGMRQASGHLRGALASRRPDERQAVASGRPVTADPVRVGAHGRPMSAPAAATGSGAVKSPGFGARAAGRTGAAPIVGRDAEIAALHTAVKRAVEGTAAIIVIEGAAGLGKSVLIDELARCAAASGVRVLRGGCRAAERDEVLGVARGLLDMEEAAAGAGPSKEGEEPDSPGRFREGASADESHEALQALFRQVQALVDFGPLVLALDDAHHADPESLRLLVHTARRMDGLPVLLVLSRQPAQTGAQETRAALLDELAAMPPARVITLRPLGLEAVTAVARGVFGGAADDGLGSACLADTGGNPLLVHMLLTVLREGGYPPTVDGLDRAAGRESARLHRVVRGLLEQQPAPVVAVARAMAVLTGAPSVDVCARLAGLDRVSFDSAVRSLRSLGLMTDDGDGAARPIGDGLIREAIAEGIPAQERRRMDLDAARLLLDDGADAELVAGHLQRSGESAHEPWAVAVLREAARCASARGASVLAVAFLRAAVCDRADSPADAAALIELGLAEAVVDVHAGVRRLRTALELASEPAQRFRALASLAGSLLSTGDPKQAIRLLDEHADDSGHFGGDRARVLMAQRLLASCEGRRRFLLTTAERKGVSGLSGDTPGERALLATQAGIDGVREGHADQAAAAAERALRRGVIGVDLPFFFITAANVLLYTDRPDKASAAYERIIDSTRRGHDRSFHSLCAAMGAEAAYRLGRLNTAVEATSAVLDGTPPRQWGRTLALPLATRIHALLDRGDVAGAESAVRELAPTSTDNWQWNEFLCARGRLRLAQDQPLEALVDLLESGRRQHAWGRTSPAVSSWWYWTCRAHLAAGAPAQARALAEDAVARARRGTLLGSLGAGLHLLALTETSTQARVALLRQALDILQKTPAKLEIARVLVEYGTALHTSGRTAAARDTLRRGLDLAHGLGADELSTRALQELHATGARPRRAASTGLDSLTPSERQVAELAATGATNRDIARLLVVTQRTVELHLTSVYRKLAVSGRRELGEHFGESPLIADQGA